MTATFSYRRTQAGEWVVYGPAASMGERVTVTKKSGETDQVSLARRGRAFVVDGVEMCYGYIEAKTPTTAPTSPAPSASRDTRKAGRGGICAECGSPRRNLVQCRDSSGLVGLCCPRCASAPAYERSFA